MELKPCPFCGSYPRPYDDRPEYCRHYTDGCPIAGEDFRVDDWNRRSPAPVEVVADLPSGDSVRIVKSAPVAEGKFEKWWAKNGWEFMQKGTEDEAALFV